MTIKQAYRLGVASGLEAAEHGDFTPEELETKDAFLEACYEICQNKRQYAGHAAEDFNREPNAEGLWDNFEDGETAGIIKGWRLRQKAIRDKKKRVAVVMRSAWLSHATNRWTIYVPKSVYGVMEVSASTKQALRERLEKECGL